MREPQRILLEILLVAGIGAAIALTANAMNPRGLKLARNYFPPPATTKSGDPGDSTPQTAPAPSGLTQASRPTDAGPSPAADPYAGLAPEIRAKLEHFGLAPIHRTELQTLFKDPMYAAGLYLIIDAREDRDYSDGHIPGAYHLYYYLEEQYINDVLPFAQGAEKIIIYCNGGDCEDSVLTAARLRDKYMIDPGRLLVYADGFEDWKNAGLPIESGVRNSGNIKEGGK